MSSAVDEMLELLRDMVSLSLEDIAFELGLRPGDAEDMLRKLRKQGLARITTHNPRRWAWDGDFVCSSCGRGVPEVRRGSGCSKFCGFCYHKHYLKGRPVPREKAKQFDSRLTVAECGTWDGVLSQKYLGIKL